MVEGDAPRFPGVSPERKQGGHMSRSAMQEPTGKDESFSPEPTDRILTVPNVIIMFRLVSIPVIAVLVAKNHLFAGLVLLAVSAMSDGVDGYVARRYNQVTKLGQILDPIADRLLIFFSVLALASIGIMPWWVLAAVVLRELVLGIQVLRLASYGYGPLPVHFVGKAGTAVLMISVPVYIVSALGEGTLFTVLHDLGDAGSIWGCALYWVAGIIYLWQGTHVIRGEKVADARTGAAR